MKISDSANELRVLIEKAIADHHITREEYDMIINKATEDANIDPHEKALLREFHDMIEDRSIKFKQSEKVDHKKK